MDKKLIVKYPDGTKEMCSSLEELKPTRILRSRSIRITTAEIPNPHFEECQGNKPKGGCKNCRSLCRLGEIIEVEIEEEIS
jgi:hypothetical protein